MQNRPKLRPPLACYGPCRRDPFCLPNLWLASTPPHSVRFLSVVDDLPKQDRVDIDRYRIFCEGYFSFKDVGMTRVSTQYGTVSRMGMTKNSPGACRA